MSAGNMLNLNQPMGTKLIRILYCIALLLIALGVLNGIVGGVRTMMRPAPMAQAAAAPTAQPPAGPPPQGANPMRPNFGPGRRGFGPPGMRRPGMGGPRMMRGPMGMRGPFMMGMRLPPPLLGGLRILLALFRGLIALMIIRVLAEIGTAILAMGAKPTK